MKFFSFSAACVPALLMYSAAVHAQAVQEPGLWEMTQTMHSESGRAEEENKQRTEMMASLPEEQRKIMEETFSAQGITLNTDGSMKIKTCITKEMADELQLPSMERDGCKTAVISRTGSEIKSEFNCSGEDGELKGYSTLTFDGPKAVTMVTESESIIDGQKDKVSIKMVGKWLSSDCGSINPAQ